MPYKKSELTPNLGVQDQADDIRGGMGFEGLMNLYQFVKDGGLLIVEGATSTIFPEYKLVNGVTVESPDGPVRARVDHARHGRRREEPDRVRLRRRADPGLLQPGSRAGRRHGRRRRARRVRRRRADSRRRDERGAERGARRRSCRRGSRAAAARGWQAPRAAGRRLAGGRGGPAAGAAAGQARRAAAAWRPAAPTRRASSCASPRTPTRCCCRACSSAVRASPTARRSSTRRIGNGPRRDVRHPARTGAGRPRARTSWASTRS